MTAAILAITPHAPAIATTVWLDGAGLSVCGLFIVNYFPFKAFSIDDEEMIDIVKENGHYVNSTLLAAAIASPVIMTLWSAILFTYTLFALIPVGFGVLAVIATLAIGWIIGKRVDTRLDNDDLKLISTHASSSMEVLQLESTQKKCKYGD
ncbi:hypothetical protein PILCRDRAFT_92571 [Piloderma croceum F 1598]|uniref:Uncharacterized protein n=1 Tax=Piloderma croceum (strain F 1598) TaxID=765440 RepID=A0A0C3F2S8_PILCF|nr:hypothetical protein PILCRDRAFT_92571 [Piloderma croceum F 1598]